MPILGGRYEVIRQLGGGGFAITYLARDIHTTKRSHCVVKQLRPNQSNPRVLEFFEKEAQILEDLGEHPLIPRLLAYFGENQNLYIVQEFIEGHDLSREIQPGKQLNEEYVVKLLQDVLYVLSFVHQREVIHRDIKPHNLMRRQQDGRIVLIDFGAVKQLGSIEINAHGQAFSTAVIGTLGYMPFEQSRGRPGLSSDLYALGMTAIYALTGIPPEHLDEDPQTGEILWQEQVPVSLSLARFLNQMTHRLPSQRYASASDALSALTHLISPIPTPPPTPPPTPSPIPIPTPPPISPISPPPPPPPPPDPPRAWSRRKLLQTAGWMGTGVAATLIGGRILEAIFEESSLQSFEFETVTVNEQGEEIDRRSGRSQFFVEELGDGVTLEMVQIPGGRFTMGSPATEDRRGDDEAPQHEVTVPGFFIGKFAVTQAQYEAIMGNNPSDFEGASRPVERVSWDKAIEFCEKLSQKTGRSYRLPSEAEWEYACRAGTTTPFHFGATITSELANYDGSSVYQSEAEGEYRERTTEVGSFPANPFGLHDMHGNVWEWCQDVYHDTYNGAPTDGSAWVKGGDDQHILRGGPWDGDSRVCRSANRFSRLPDVQCNCSGFRVVLSA